ncbi:MULTISPECIES: DinB family protein [unclassified Streptomyces]|uniref:DinB family protein n=1 Tax=unclassified Streptomyces TaxID=2593676 RepID=UPI00202F1581|nr:MULTISPECIES: DinB family protein [unclassified Streptomyces]MCM1966805.1 DinB family protein [Streptomyces sp. G1]MCX5126181.1 DinB family protein [Streptomyces sp. NBC_00347]MCX5299811.1 DinB family protein [Streptomyces sp. NBC_00193]
MTISDGSHRSEPSTTADEREMLDGWLDYHRSTLAWKCEGLSDAQLRTTPLLPSGLSLMGLVRHMAEVERYWFREIMLDEELPDLYWSSENPDGDFHFADGDTWAAAEQVWQTEIELARQAVAGRSLDLASKPESHRRGEVFSLRWVYTHMIEEYARHNGHADLLREHLDGATGE